MEGLESCLETCQERFVPLGLWFQMLTFDSLSNHRTSLQRTFRASEAGVILPDDAAPLSREDDDAWKFVYHGRLDNTEVFSNS